MPYIEIKTVHNVVVAYETATLVDRIIALIIDAAIVLLAFLFLMIGVGLVGASPGSDLYQPVITLITLPLVAFYHLFCENMFDGQSPGKKMMGIKVVKANGRQGTFQDYFIRWVFRLIDILFSIGSLAAIMVSTSQRAQRLGDVLANTVVVKTLPRRRIGLESLVAMRTTENYTPLYQEAVRLTEEQAVLIKQVLDRYTKYPNKASGVLLKELQVRISEELGIQEINQPIRDFLKTLLKDYVVLTR